MKKAKLIGQKERLINEIADLGLSLYKPLYKISSFGSDLPSSEGTAFKKNLKVAFSGMCGVLERKECMDREAIEYLVANLARNPEDQEFLDNSLAVLPFLNDGTGTVELTVAFKNYIAAGLKIPIEQLPETDINRIFNKIKDLIQVIKQIRELN